MNDSIKTTNIQFETAVLLLARHLPHSDESSRKPILFHDIRVGTYLYERAYAHDIVLAGVLHDAIEWSTITEKMLLDQFGKNVTKLVLACTKDDSITDKEKKTTELITRCVNSGQDALIVKTADIIDSFKFYSRVGNQDELQNHCMKNASVIFTHKPSNFTDPIFEELKKWQEIFQVRNKKL